MKHGNKKYNFEPLKNTGGEVTEETSNIYALKSSLRTFLGHKLAKLFEFTEIEPNIYHIKRIS